MRYRQWTDELYGSVVLTSVDDCPSCIQPQCSTQSVDKNTWHSVQLFLEFHVHVRVNGNILYCIHRLTGSVLWYRVLFGPGSVASTTSYFVSTPFAVLGGDQLRSNLRFSSSSASASFSKLLILMSDIVSGDSEWLSILQNCVVGTRLQRYWLPRSTRSCRKKTLKSVDLLLCPSDELVHVHNN